MSKVKLSTSQERVVIELTPMEARQVFWLFNQLDQNALPLKLIELREKLDDILDHVKE
jgi:hypothetical protein